MQQLAPLHSVVETWAENVTGAARTSVLLPNVLFTVQPNRQDNLFGLLLNKTQDRFVAVEQQNEVLEGGRHRKDLESAVKAAEASTEARLRGAFAATHF